MTIVPETTQIERLRAGEKAAKRRKRAYKERLKALEDEFPGEDEGVAQKAEVQVLVDRAEFQVQNASQTIIRLQIKPDEE